MNKPLKTLYQHNTEALERHRQSELTGVACPNCNFELSFADDLIYASYPPQRRVVCMNADSDCNYNGFLYMN